MQAPCRPFSYCAAIDKMPPKFRPAYSHIFFFHDPATTEIYTLSLHDALPIWRFFSMHVQDVDLKAAPPPGGRGGSIRSEEHTSELQSPMYLVCRLLLEKKKEGIGTFTIESITVDEKQY